MRVPMPEIRESLDDLQRRLRRCRDARMKMRLHLLVLIASGEVSSRQEAAERLAQHRNTIGRWLRVYQQEGLDGLLTIPSGGAPTGVRRVSPGALDALRQRLDEDEGFASYGEAQQWLQEEFGETVPYTTVHGWVRYRFKTRLKRSRSARAHRARSESEQMGFS